MPLHLIKLCVGARSLADLQARQSGADQPPCHQTRNFPRRAREILDGGSLYWVINRIVTARQEILAIEEAERQDGKRCTDLILQPLLIPVHPQFRKPFQGWRYLAAHEAPPDSTQDGSHDRLPEKLQRELAALCLL